MPELNTAQNSLSFFIDSHFLKGARVNFVKSTPHIQNLFSVALKEKAETEHVKPLDIPEIQSIGNNDQNCLLVSGISSSMTLVRPMEIKLKKQKDIDSVLAFQAEPLLPYPVETAILDKITVSQSVTSTFLTLISVKKEELKNHLLSIHELKKEPEVVSCVPIALTQFSCFLKGNTHHSLIIVNIDLQETSTVVVCEGKLLASHSLSQGFLNLALNLAKDKELSLAESLDQLKKLDFSHISSSSFPFLYQACETLKLEVAKTVFAMSKQGKGHVVSEIIFTGEGGASPSLTSFLHNGLNLSLGKITIASDQPIERLLEYAVPIGLALCVQPSIYEQVNFRQQEYAYPHPWKRFKRPLEIYLALCLCIGCLFYGFNLLWMGYEGDKIKKDYLYLLADINKSYEDFEKEYFKKTDPSNENFARPLEKLSLQEIMQRLLIVENQMQVTPDVFPLLPNIPRVSDILAWLASHPNVVLYGNEGESLLQIENFSYSLVKRPEQTKKQEKYQVKVELEFSTPTPKLAREFHDALISPNELVDPKGEIKWNSSRDKYRTSFFLKDKTIYPSTAG